MASVNQSLTPNKESSFLSPSKLLQLSRPSFKCEFVRQGDRLHLLIYLNSYCKVPFIRVPSDAIYRAAKRFLSDA